MLQGKNEKNMIPSSMFGTQEDQDFMNKVHSSANNNRPDTSTSNVAKVTGQPHLKWGYLS